MYTLSDSAHAVSVSSKMVRPTIGALVKYDNT